MAHFTPSQLEELLSGEHGLLALEAGREILEKAAEIDSLRMNLTMLQASYNEACMSCRQAQEEAARAQGEMRVLAEKYATLIAVLKDLGVGEDGKKIPNKEKDEGGGA